MCPVRPAMPATALGAMPRVTVSATLKTTDGHWASVCGAERPVVHSAPLTQQLALHREPPEPLRSAPPVTDLNPERRQRLPSSHTDLSCFEIADPIAGSPPGAEIINVW